MSNSKLDTTPLARPPAHQPCSGRLALEDDANGAPCEGLEGHDGDCVAHIRVTFKKQQSEQPS